MVDDGWPAFPTPRYERGDMYSLGMTLRDYFAAKALAAFIAEPIDGIQEAMVYELGDMTCDDFAKGAYKMADAMLKARQA